MPNPQRIALLLAVSLAAALTAAGVTLHAAMSGQSKDGQVSNSDRNPLAATARPLTIYAGRSESLVGEIIRNFERETGITVRIRYGGTGPLAATILEEGTRCGVDVFFAQDPGGLGVLAKRDRLATLPATLVDRVAYEHRDPLGRWVGITGRLRTLAYSTERVKPAELPDSRSPPNCRTPCLN